MFGISSLSLKGMELDRAIVEASEAGFDVFEFVPQVFGSLKSYTSGVRQKLRKMFEEFEMVTIHTSDIKLGEGLPLDVASEDRFTREKSIETYLDYIELALDVGAQIASFHPSPKDKLATHCENPEPYLEFADIALKHVNEENLQLAYEFFDVDLIYTIAESKFGLLFDVGHAASLFGGETTKGVLRLLKKALPVTVELHLHGVDFTNTGLKIDHLPISKSRAINQLEVFKLITDTNFAGPLVFEIGIFRTGQANENLKYSVEAREKLLESLEIA